jgi:uncharacterized membrane protein YeaQ/YmgE (transglycosylase-associated protein family)
MEFLWFLVIGLAAGWLAGQVMGNPGVGVIGVIGDIAVGVLGALLGGFLFRRLGVSTGSGLFANLIVATIGAIVLLFVVRQFKKI